MRAALFALLLIVSGRAFGAAGDITAFAISSDGYRLLAYAQGFSTNLAVNPELSTNNYPSPNSRGLLIVQSPGNATDGTTNVLTRECWVLRAVRIPGLTNMAVSPHGSGVVAELALSDPVWTNDTIVSMTALAGLISDGGTNSAQVVITTVTNLSQLPYPIPTAKPSEHPGRIMTNGYVRTIGFGYLADDGRPLQFVEHILTGVSSGNIVTSRTSRMTIVRDRQQGLPAAEFVTASDMSGFTTNEYVRIDTRIGGRVGFDFDTRDGIYTYPDHRLAAYTNVYSPNNDYTHWAALVGPHGNDSTGSFFNRTTTDVSSVNTNTAFLTFAGAFNAMARTNGILYGRTNIGGSEFWQMDGITNFMDGTYPSGITTTDSRVVPFIRKYPGHSPTLTTRVGSNDAGTMIGLDGVNTAWASSQVPFNNMFVIVHNNITNLASVSTAPISGASLSDYQVWFDNCIFGAYASGLKPPTAADNGSYHVRNSVLSMINVSCAPVFMMGCVRLGTNGGESFSVVTDRAGQTGYSPENTIWFNNIIESGNSASAVMEMAKWTNYPSSALPQAIVQNAFLKTSNPGLGPLSSIASGVTNEIWGGILWHNAFIGGRQADRLSASTWTNDFVLRPNWTIAGNAANTAVGHKNDLWGAGTVDPERFLIPLFGGGVQHEWFGEGTDASVTGNSFPPDHPGLYSYLPPSGLNFTNLLNAYAWRGYKGWGEGGNMNYRLNVQSPGRRMNTVGYRYPRWALSHDLFGRDRSRYDPPGPISAN